MHIKVVGYVNQDYTLDSGYSFKGRKVHAIDCSTVSPNQVGQQVITFRIPAASELATFDLVPGQDYTIYFTAKGAPDFLCKFDKEGGTR